MAMYMMVKLKKWKILLTLSPSNVPGLDYFTNSLHFSDIDGKFYVGSITGDRASDKLPLVHYIGLFEQF